MRNLEIERVTLAAQSVVGVEGEDEERESQNDAFR